MQGEEIYDSAGEFYASVKSSFEELEIFPVPNGVHDHVEPLGNPGDERLKDVVRSFGWPPKPDGQVGRRKSVSRKSRECGTSILESIQALEALA